MTRTLTVVLLIIFLSPVSFASKSVEKNIEVYEGSSLNRPFIIIGKIHEKDTTPKMLISKVKKLAIKNNADAVLNYRVETINVRHISGQGINTASGILVRWPIDNENGIYVIDSKTVIPVIQ